jgi:hypothetical protein
MSHFKHKLATLYILSAVRLQTAVSIFVIKRDLVQLRNVECIVAGGTVNNTV